MIVYGTNSKNLGTRRIPGEKCPTPDSQEDIEIVGIVKYFHVFWIPLFPYSKKVYPYCKSLDMELNHSDLSQKTIDKIKEEKKKMKTPFYMYSGLIIIALLIGLLIYNDGKHEEEVTQNIKNIQQTDIIVLHDDEDGNYTFAVVDEVKQDTVTLRFSNYYFDGIPSERDYNNERFKYDDFYDTIPYKLLKSDLDSLRQKELIYDLFRRE